MIIQTGNIDGSANTYGTENRLFKEIEHIVPLFYSCYIRAGTVQHDQSKTGEQNNDCDQIIIIIMNPLCKPSYRFSFFHISKQ